MGLYVKHKYTHMYAITQLQIYVKKTKLDAKHSIDCITPAGHSIAFLHFVAM